MKLPTSLPILLTSLVLLAVLDLSFAEAADLAPGLPVRLPRDSATPILVLDFDDNTTRESPQDDLYLAIYSDGQAVVSAAGDRGRQLTGRIPESELRALLQTLLVDNRLLECRTTALQEDVRIARAARRRPTPGPDAATTVIRVRTAEQTLEVRCHALGLTASQLPELQRVHQLFDCQQRLENVAAIIRAGGYDNVHAVLHAANRQLRQEAPQTELLTSRELSLVDIRADGTRYLQFARLPNADGLQPPGGFVIVSVYQSPGRPPEVIVTADAS